MNQPSAPPIRRAASELPAITGLRFLPQQADATLVNISTKGLLAESTTRLVVGDSVQVELLGGFSPRPVASRVVRCQLAMMGPDGVLRYDIAVEFDEPIALDEHVAIALAEEIAASIEPPFASAARNRW